MLFGHTEKIKLFKSLVERDLLGHAYLFFGDDQIGKRAFANHFARFIEYGDFKEDKRPLLDTMMIVPDERGKIGIDLVRQLKRFVFQKPFHARRRIAIIDNAHTLTPEAESALLKIVEEPPVSTLLIFITQNADTLFSPLRSRLEEMYFQRFSEKEVEEFLIKVRNIPVSQAGKIAKESFGRVGYALDLCEEKTTDAENLEEVVSDRISELYKKGVKKYSHEIKKLLDREVVIRQYNVNANLQGRVIKEI